MAAHRGPSVEKTRREVGEVKVVVDDDGVHRLKRGSQGRGKERD